MAKGPKPVPPEVRFWRYVNKTDGCWLWTGSKAGQYGGFWISGQGTERVRAYAHRYSYELHVGPIPNGLMINHLCEVKLCVRPDHLEAVTARENMLYGNHPAARRAAQTHCVHGHPFDETNTYLIPTGGRRCRTCNRLQAREYGRRKRAS